MEKNGLESLEKDGDTSYLKGDMDDKRNGDALYLKGETLIDDRMEGDTEVGYKYLPLQVKKTVTPLDSGYAWLVLFASLWALIITVGVIISE